MALVFVLFGIICLAGGCEVGNDCCLSGGSCIDPVFDDCMINGRPGKLDYQVDCSPYYRTCCLPETPPTETSPPPTDPVPASTTTQHHRTTTQTMTSAPYEGCGLTSNMRVVGGSEASPHSWPWQVSLKIDYGVIAQEHYCGGTLINNQWVVTAAHCLKTMGADDLKVILGAHGKPGWENGSGFERTIALTITHPGYTGNAGSPDDLALVKLTDPVQVDDNVRPACLPTSNLPQFVFEDSPECWITGWGETKGTGDENVLNELQVSVVPQEYCRSQWSANPNVLIGDGQICINNGLTGACNGDSGGPLVCKKDGRWVLAGATSFGVKGCQTEGAPDVYTRISFYLPWIMDQIELNY